MCYLILSWKAGLIVGHLKASFFFDSLLSLTFAARHLRVALLVQCFSHPLLTMVAPPLDLPEKFKGTRRVKGRDGTEDPDDGYEQCDKVVLIGKQ